MTAHDPFGVLPDVPTFRLSSTSFSDGDKLASAQLSAVFGVPGGKDLSPQLSWSGVPEGTKSYTITLFDPDAPDVGGFWHWAVVNIPGTVTELQEGAGARDGSGLPPPAFQLKNDGGFRGYLGAAAPKGHGPHRYVVTVVAVDVAELDVSHDAHPTALISHLESHAVGMASITGTFGR